MKTVSGITLAVMASGQYIRADIYDITLKSGGILRYTSAEVPLPIGGNTYQNNLIINRGNCSQKTGVQVESLDITISPQFDHPLGTPMVGGLPILQAVYQGLFDNADVLWSKLFMPKTNFPDTSGGAIPWWRGTIDTPTPGETSANLACQSALTSLQRPMPRNVYQAGCLHTVFDTGCGLNKITFTVSGAVSGTPTSINFNTNLTNITGYFDLGVITFTSGANNGFSRTIKTYLNASGNLTMIYPLPSAPIAGDTFTIIPGCDKLQSTCNTKFSNIIRFRGYPYIPNPETPYDGGASAVQAVPASGAQSDVTMGSNYGGNFKGRVYIP